jgi:hypothetical protein
MILLIKGRVQVLLKNARRDLFNARESGNNARSEIMLVISEKIIV